MAIAKNDLASPSDDFASELSDNPVQKLTQSKYFTPQFNAAIYDGPLRIYFSQVHESEALKVYFHLQQKILVEQPAGCARLAETGQNIFVMLYPSNQSFVDVFGATEERTSAAPIVCEKLGEDMVVGVLGPLQDTDYGALCDRLTVSPAP